VDVSVDEVRGGLSSWLPRRRGLQRAAARDDVLSDAEATDRVARWELAATLVVLFVLGRTPLLFLRDRTASVFWPIKPLWQDDVIVASVFAVAQFAIVVMGVLRARARVLLEQPFLLAFLAFAWLSMSWSVEPSITMRRALLMAGTAGVGWYIGDRFSLRDQIRVVTWLGWIAAGTTIFALFVWNRLARSTGADLGFWSGVYVNRNALALVLALGLLGSLFFLRVTSRTAGIRWMIGLQVFLLLMTKSRTPLIGLAVSITVVVVVHWLRRRRGAYINSAAAAYVVFALFATGGLVVHWYWVQILKHLGRDPNLTGRTLVWELVRWFTRLHPWRGWGFESIWANAHAIGQAQAAHGSYAGGLGHGIPGGWPFAAHNGYYDLILGVGYIGLVLFVGFLGVASWRAFRKAWTRTDPASLWPLAIVVFAIVVNFSESLFVSSEAVFALTVAAAVTATNMRPTDPAAAVVPASDDLEPAAQRR
jgi:O-antigen ligase